MTSSSRSQSSEVDDVLCQPRTLQVSLWHYIAAHVVIMRPVRDACLHMGGILAEGFSVSAGSASLPTYSVFSRGWNFFKLGTYI